MRLHADHARGAARGGFEAECAGAREQIEAAFAFERLAKPVEHGFAHPVGRRAQAVELRDGERRAFPLPADDADLVFARGGGGRHDGAF